MIIGVGYNPTKRVTVKNKQFVKANLHNIERTFHSLCHYCDLYYYNCKNIKCETKKVRWNYLEVKGVINGRDKIYNF